jgi:uncharacterized repeat protein (TIGR04002 family)
MNDKKIRTMCVAGVFAAIIFVFTAYLHFPTHMGYIHIGDGFIYLAACLLPMPYAIFAGAAGAALADLLSGFAVWAPATVVIKALAVILFYNKGEKIICKRNLLPLIPAAFICVGGYYLYEVILVGNFVAPLSCMHTNVTQSVLSSATFIITGIALDKMKIKDKIKGM